MCILLALVLACRALAHWALPLGEDAFISFRYARNLAQGSGLVYNPGEPWEPVLGAASAGYSALLGVFLRLGLTPERVSLALGLSCALASAWFLLELLERRRVGSTLALLCFALLPRLGMLDAAGGEGPLFTALALGAVLALQRDHARISGLLGVLATLVRPEGALLILLLGWSARASRPTLRRFTLPVAILGALSLVGVVYTYGDLIPHSLRSALGSAHDTRAAGWRGELQFVIEVSREAFVPHALLLVALPLVLLGAWRSLGRKGAPRTLSLFVLGMSACFLLARVHPWSWRLQLPLCVWCLWLAEGAQALIARWGSRIPSDALALVRERAVVFGAPLLLLAYGSVAATEREHVTERVYAPLQEWARSIGRVSPRARILAADIGALGWAWSGTVFDCAGRTWPLASQYTQPNRMARDLRPEYLLLAVDSHCIGHFYSDADLRARYVPIARFSPSGAQELELDPRALAQSCGSDFLVFRRRDLADGFSN
ncbi:MAG: hypothetical protein IPJ19_02665 [Planctomycetes bacterium]|nr:hypothetical protein [Planctomycetota bacterium]